MIQFQPLCFAMGAEVIGVDISQPLSDPVREQIYAAFIQYSVLLFRSTPISRDQHITFSRYFGEVDNNERTPRIRHPNYPEIQIITNKIKTTDIANAFAGMIWHSDQSYSTQPAKATLLHALEVPAIGGDTMLSNMYLAYETLSKTMQEVLEPLEAVHFGGKARLDNSSVERAAHTAKANPPTAHKIVQIHPETGKKSLFIGNKVKQIVGMNHEESRLIIDYLNHHMARTQFCYRHAWKTHDVLVWDNRCTNHVAVGDYDRRYERQIDRTTVKGLPNGYAYTGPILYEGPRL